MFIAVGVSLWSFPAGATDVEDLKRTLEAMQAHIQKLEAENKALANRVTVLEAEQPPAAASIEGDARQREARLPPPAATPGANVPSDQVVTVPPREPVGDIPRYGQEDLERRVTELETTVAAQEDATRYIIRDSLASTGSNINELVSFGGNLEFSGGWGDSFDSSPEGFLEITTADLEFEIRANDWTVGVLKLEYDDGSNLLVETVDGVESVIPRINVDQAFVSVGDTDRFPPFFTIGQIVVPFGITSGDPVTDNLTIEDPLTTDAFEQRQVAVGVGVAFPTPDAVPPGPAIEVPEVQPEVLNPLLTSLFRAAGFTPTGFPPPQTTTYVPSPEPPAFNAAVYVYNGETTREGSTKGGFTPQDHIAATVGYRTQGGCGRPYDEVGQWDFCPWSLDVDVDFNSSVFDSLFLRSEYNAFLDQIGIIPGMAFSVKGAVGPISLVGEWNGAITQAVFRVDGNRVAITPSAWQVSAGYQFDWNPWVAAIGEQGTFLAATYSETSDLAGVTQIVDGEGVRVGNLPRRRMTFNASEWVLPNLKFALEYSYEWDYSVSEGGTGGTANVVFGAVTYVW